MVSIPRDSWVKVDGYPENNGHAKINAAFSYGGPQLALTTVEELTDVSIDHVAIIDWVGFKDLTSALGGVRVYIPETFYDDSQKNQWDAGLDQPRGRRGAAVRAHPAWPGQRRLRPDRPAAELHAGTDEERCCPPRPPRNPVKFTKVLASVSGYLTVDDTWDTDEIRDLAWSMRGVRSNDITFFTAPIAGVRHQAVEPQPERAGRASCWTAANSGSWSGPCRTTRPIPICAEHPDAGLPGERSVS